MERNHAPGPLGDMTDRGGPRIARGPESARRRGEKHRGPPSPGGDGGPRWLWDPAMTDFRARGTIMGPAGLTAVFGMGTGGTPPVSSPELAGAGGQPRRAQLQGSTVMIGPSNPGGMVTHE